MENYRITWNLTNSNLDFKDFFKAESKKEAIKKLHKTYKCAEIYRVDVL